MKMGKTTEGIQKSNSSLYLIGLNCKKIKSYFVIKLFFKTHLISFNKTLKR